MAWLKIFLEFWLKNWLTALHPLKCGSQYIGEFEMLILSSKIVIGEFWLIFSYAVMLICREFLEFSSFWREIQLNLKRAGETNGEFVTHII